MLLREITLYRLPVRTNTHIDFWYACMGLDIHSVTTGCLQYGACLSLAHMTVDHCNQREPLLLYLPQVD